jgi:sulfide dehydrogenase cytochrome subunit
MGLRGWLPLAFYSGDNMTRWNRIAAVGMLTTLCGWASAQAFDPLQVRGWASTCATCHGTAGIAQPGMESLAGANKDEILKKMMDFKTGKKPATLMHQLSKGYSDEQLQALAAYFAALKK